MLFSLSLLLFDNGQLSGGKFLFCYRPLLRLVNMICFHEEYCLPACDAMQPDRSLPKFRRKDQRSRAIKQQLLKHAIFWVMTPCSLETARRYRGIYRFQLNGLIRSQARNYQKQSSSLWLASADFFLGLLLDPEVDAIRSLETLD
jgi:hypothetical protein